MASPFPRHVHLVGSIGLDSVDEVFQRVGTLLGRRLKRIPDGEPGPRRLWVSFQYPLLRSSPYLRPDPSGAVRVTNKFPLLCVADGVGADEVAFGELGYAREARASYLDFCAARKQGHIAAGVRFQVCLPTPMGVIYAFCSERDVVAIDRAYERAMIWEVKALVAAIPHQDLSIQWDFCHEMLILDGQPQTMFPLVDASMDAIMARMARLGAAVPSDVELGVHLCYGDFGARHFIEPVDAARLVAVANGLAESIVRRLDFLHLPIPLQWSQPRHFAPLSDLRLAAGTEIYLGLVHAADGAAGAAKRIGLAEAALARAKITDFGIATECGIARQRKSDLVGRIIALQAEIAPEPAA